MASILTKLLGSLSPKRVLVINFDYEHKGVNYVETLKKGLDCTCVKWEDLAFTDGQLTVNGEPLSAFSFVLLGVVGDHGLVYSAALAAVQAAGLPYLSYGRSEELNNKALQTVNFRLNGVAHPKTVILTAKPEAADDLIRGLQLPLVTKIIDGSQGKGIEKHDTKDSLVKELKTRQGALLIVQEALQASCDYRVFFLNDEITYIGRRSSNKKTEFRHNVSLGGTIERAELPPEAVALARQANKAMGFDAAGVDLLQDEPTGKWYVLEVNSAPQFINLEETLAKLIEVIRSRL